MSSETFTFQAEINQLLHLVINSLYSNDEIFLRELISNASDAAEKLKFAALTNNELYEGQGDLLARLEVDKDAKTITIIDNGIGMSREDVIQNLGTIAKSGTKEFLKALTGDQSKDARLIGQFGVGFYSAFIVADEVTVETRKAGLKPEEGIRWQSKGDGQYSLENCTMPERGTKITLHLRPEKEEFLQGWKLKSIIHKYSDHIPLPVQMRKEDYDDKGNMTLGDFENVNRATALWTLSKSEIKEEEYKEFYKHVSHDFDEPLSYSHNKVEGKQEYTTLLYIPKHAPFDLWNRENTQHGLKLYVQRVFIMDNAEHFLPHYLRFVKGIVDSNDLPLNVSREILQTNKVVETIKSAVTKRVLAMLNKMAADEPENYKTFWKEFGQVLKEGTAEDFTNKEEIAGLLRFATTHDDSNEAQVSLEQYIARMKEDQDKIYYITSENINTARFSPHMEIFRQKGIEVLLLTDRIDEWLVMHLSEFQGKKLQSVAKGEVELDKNEDETVKQEKEKLEEAFKDVLTRVKETLGDKIKEVRASNRLTNSPACIVVDEAEMNLHMQQLLKAAGQAVPNSKPILELNLKHPLVDKLNRLENQAFIDLSHVLLEQAMLVEGVPLEDPVKFVQRMNELLI